jgi:hypothetical protein
MSTAETLRPQLDRLQRLFLTVGVVGLALSLLGGWFSPREFYPSYLVAYLFWIGIALGSIGIVMLHHLVGGTWGFVIRRLLESGTTTVWLMAALSLPIFLGLKDIYPWARPASSSHDSIRNFKDWYLSTDFFLGRSVVYFAVWIVLGHLLNRWSAQQAPSAAQRAGPRRALPDVVVRRDRLGDVPGAKVVFDNLRGDVGHRPGAGNFGLRDHGRRPPGAYRATVRSGVAPPVQRPRKPAACVRHAVVLYVVLSIFDHLVRQPHRGDPLVPAPHARRLAMGRAGLDRLPLLFAVLRSLIS